jgi:DNA-binding MurR/RpiR family transcriptional regulator
MPSPAEEAITSGDVIETLRLTYGSLTHTQKRIAEYIIEKPQVVAFSTVDAMAAKIGVNPSTIVRFAYRNGLNGFTDLQERMRDLVRGQLSRADDPNEGEAAGHLVGTSFGASLSNDRHNLQHTISGLDPGTLGLAVHILCQARNVYVVAEFSAFPVAQHCALALDRLRGSTWLLASHDASATIPIAKMLPEDCVLAFTFPPYASGTRRIVRQAKDSAAKVVAVTESRFSAVGLLGDAVLLAASAGTGLQNSMVAPMAVANALLNGISGVKGALVSIQEHSALMTGGGAHAEAPAVRRDAEEDWGG